MPTKCAKVNIIADGTDSANEPPSPYGVPVGGYNPDGSPTAKNLMISSIRRLVIAAENAIYYESVGEVEDD